jgi:adenylylsulfate kinase
MTDSSTLDITWHEQKVSRNDRQKIKGHRSAVLWFTGLSAAGKSTIANAVELRLNRRGVHTYVLDGDNIRHGLNRNLGFTAEDRAENIRRIGEVAGIMADAGLITLTAFISPYRTDRDKVRASLGTGRFIEIYCNASLATCESRDPKGLYKKARSGELKQFTGIDDPYETPEKAEIVLDSGHKDASVLADDLVDYLETTGVLPSA